MRRTIAICVVLASFAQGANAGREDKTRRAEVRKLFRPLSRLSVRVSKSVRERTRDLVDVKLNFRKSRGYFRVGDRKGKVPVALMGDIVVRHKRAQVALSVHLGQRLRLILPPIRYARGGWHSRANNRYGDRLFVLRGSF